MTDTEGLNLRILNNLFYILCQIKKLIELIGNKLNDNRNKL